MEKDNIFSLDNSDKSTTVDNNMPQSETLIESSNEENNKLDSNILRDRTFNKELSDLVSRIQSNEALKDEPHEIKETTDDELLLMFHQLYYKAINLTNVNNINTDLNPFDLFKESSSDDLLNLIHNEMNNLTFSEFAILTYNFEKKCYKCYCNYIDNINANNIILATAEALYTNIINSKNGIVLDVQAIERNFFLKKRFSQGKTLYLISFNNFFKDFYNNADLETVNDFSSYFLPILMIQLNENIRENQKKPIYNFIKNKLTAYFFLLQKKILIEIQDSNSHNLLGFYNYLDYTYQAFNKYNDCVCIIIKCKKYINIEVLFILKYLQIKLRNRLIDKITTSRIDKDKLIIFTQKSKKKLLDEIIEDYNKLYKNLFQIEIFINEETSNNIYFLQNIKQYLAK